MGYYGKLEEKLLAQNLRKQGYSYREIQSKVDVSKDTLSRWCRNIVLTSDQLIILNQKRKDGGMKGSLVGSKKQQIR
jgi:transposase